MRPAPTLRKRPQAPVWVRWLLVAHGVALMAAYPLLALYATIEALFF